LFTKYINPKSSVKIAQLLTDIFIIIIIFPMINQNVTVELLRMAITGEKKSANQYLKFALETQELSGKNMYILLTIDELLHRELLERIFNDLQLVGSCSPLEIPATTLEKIVPKINDKTQRIKGKAGQNALDALLTALELETNARNFYRQQADKTIDETARKLFLRLAQMEQAHLDIIQAEIDHIQEFGFWLGFQEFTLEANP